MAKNFKKSLVKNSFWGFTSSLANRVGGLIFTIILARFLFTERFGVYTLVISTAMIFFTFADLGINSTLVRYLSKAIQEDKTKVSSYYRYLLKLKLIFVITASFLLLILAYPISIYVYKNAQLLIPLIVAAIYIIVLSFENFYTQIFYAIEKVDYTTFKEFLHQVLRICFTLFVIFVVASSYHVTGIFLGLILTAIIILIVVIYYTKKLIPSLYEKPKQRIDKKRVKVFLGFLTIASISAIFFSYIDTIMLGIFVSPEFVGLYRASFSLVFGITGLVSFSNTIFLSVFTKLKKSNISFVLNKAFKYLSIISIPSVFGLLILGKYFVKLFYGITYIDSTLSLSILTLLIFPTVSIGLFLSLFSAEEKPQIFAKLIIATTIINIILNVTLIKIFLKISPLWATFGAGLATVISWIFYFVASIFAIKKLKFNLNIKQLTTPIISAIIMSGVLIFYLRDIQDMNFALGVLSVLIGLIVYAVSIFLIDKDLREDLKEFKSLFNLKLK